MYKQRRKMQTANDTYQDSDRKTPSFSPLANGGVTLPKTDPTYELPQLNGKKNAWIFVRLQPH